MQRYVVVHKASVMMQHSVRCARRCLLMTQHFELPNCVGVRQSGWLISSCIRVCITSCDSSSYSNLTGLPGDCAGALPCGEASFKLGELVKGPGVDYGPRLKSMPWAWTLS